MKILLVEDDKKVASFIHQGLTEQSYIVDVARDGLEGEQFARQNEYDLLIVDLMLPRKSGFAVCRTVRSYDPSIPLLILTALDSIDDKVQGFETGADDYLVKPFEFRELLLRIRALLRRKTIQPTTNVLRLADLEIDVHARTVTRSGKQIELTAREYALLEYLAQNRNRIVSRVDIAEHIWETDFDSESNVIEVYINFLRRKIDKHFSPKLIHTVVGMGYVLREGSE